MNLAENMTSQQLTKRQQYIYHQVQKHAPVIDNRVNFCSVRLRDSARDEYLVAQTALKTTTQKSLWLTASIPQFSNHIFMGLSEHDPDLMNGLIARLDAQSEVNDKIRAGFFGGIHLRSLNQAGWYGFFIIPVNKWLKQFPLVIDTLDPLDDSTEKSHYSLVVLLTKNELEFARRQGNRKLYQRLKKSRQTPYYVNTTRSDLSHTDAASQTMSRAKRAQHQTHTDPLKRQDIIQRSQLLRKLPSSQTQQPSTENSGSSKDISLEIHDSEFPLAPPSTPNHKNITQPSSSNLSAYQRLKGDLRSEIRMKTTEELVDERFSEPTEELGTIKHLTIKEPNRLTQVTKKIVGRWFKKPLLNSQENPLQLPNIPLKLQIVGETLSGGSFAVGGFILSIFLIGNGHISASLFSVLFTSAGILMLIDAYRMSKNVNNN